MMMNLDFSGKNVLITGGSRGIGRACARLFSELRAHVSFTYKSDHAAARDTLAQLGPGGNHKSYQLDITRPDNIALFFKQYMHDHERLDVLVNNAGVYIKHALAEVSYEEWQASWNETIQTNLSGVANLCYLASRQMIQQGEGKIVNISSRGAFRGEPEHPAYGASKAGLNALSQSLARYLAPYHITVGVVAPGYVETDMAAAQLTGDSGEEIRNQSPMKRVAIPLEVARVVAVFAASGFEYMSGGIIDINGASYLRT